MIGLIDYKLSNINSVSNVLRLLDKKFRLIEQKIPKKVPKDV